MKYAIKIISLVLAAVTTISMAGCAKSIYEKVEATAVYNNAEGENVGNQQNEGNLFNGDSTIVTDQNGNLTIEQEEEIVLDDNGVSNNAGVTNGPGLNVNDPNAGFTNNNANVTANNNRVPATQGNRVPNSSNNGVPATQGNVPATNKVTTTQKSIVVPNGVAAVLSAYNAAANRTKALNNMTIDKTNDVEIVIDDLAGSATITKLANSVASSFMKKYNGQSFREVYVNGRPTRNTTEMDLQYPNMLANDKRLFIPVRNKNYMCTLTPSDVLSATATQISKTQYKVIIKLRSESTHLNTPPAMITRGMDYFEQKVFDLQGFQFVDGTANYRNCVITGIVNADGYLDFAENKMSVSSTNAKVSILGLELDGKIHGDYITTLKFTIK